MGPRRLRLLLAAAAVACGVLGLLAARHRATRRHAAPIWPDATVVHLPHLKGAITLDGDIDDMGWRGKTLRTGPFVGADGETPMRPDTEARALWGDGFLYMDLYAADQDIQVRSKGPDALSPEEDAFHLAFTDATTERILDITALGVVTDGIRPRGSTLPPDLSWSSHVHVSHELDGSPNHPSDDDEEWVLEVAIPFEALGLEGEPGETIGLAMHRCDTPHDGVRRCGAWGEATRRVLVLDPP